MFLNDNYWVSLQVSQNFVPKDPVNSLRPRQTRCHFADYVFKCNFLNENVWIPIKISLKFVPKGPINNIPVLVQIMAWRWTGDKPLSEPMMTQFNNAYMRHFASIHYVIMKTHNDQSSALYILHDTSVCLQWYGDNHIQCGAIITHNRLQYLHNRHPIANPWG